MSLKLYSQPIKSFKVFLVVNGCATRLFVLFRLIYIFNCNAFTIKLNWDLDLLIETQCKDSYLPSDIYIFSKLVESNCLINLTSTASAIQKYFTSIGFLIANPLIVLLQNC